MTLPTHTTHTKSQVCLQRGVFDGLKSFPELEARISALATTQERGAAFEVFTEAYLATLAVEKTKAIWPGSRITPTLRKRLALPSDDVGVDGIIETQLGDTFDLALFDEAHKTAGREGVHFGFALADQNLPIRQRLFLTATPRHYDVRHRDREGDARLVYSMDAPEIHGPVAHQLTFAEAARRGIISRYKVVVSVVTSEMVNAHVLRHGEVIVQGDAVQARHALRSCACRSGSACCSSRSNALPSSTERIRSACLPASHRGAMSCR